MNTVVVKFAKIKLTFKSNKCQFFYYLIYVSHLKHYIYHYFVKSALKLLQTKKKESKCHFLDYITTLPTSTETTARFNKIKNKNQT